MGREEMEVEIDWMISPVARELALDLFGLELGADSWRCDLTEQWLRARLDFEVYQEEHRALYLSWLQGGGSQHFHEELRKAWKNARADRDAAASRMMSVGRLIAHNHGSKEVLRFAWKNYGAQFSAQ
jgi:hypothetical protein